MELAEIETSIAEVWKEMFELDQVAEDANFFDLGGDSLMATVMAFRIEALLGRPIATSLIFDHPTIKDLILALDD